MEKKCIFLSHFSWCLCLLSPISKLREAGLKAWLFLQEVPLVQTMLLKKKI